MSETPSINPSKVHKHEETKSVIASSEKDISEPKKGKGFRFWAIIVSLSIVSLLASLENTVVATSLPTIVRALNIGDNYVWVTNIIFLTNAVSQPLFGQLANIFGRRHVTLLIVSMYTLGCGICGGATNTGMMIAGRAIQGIGSGGINMIIEVIVSDLVPLRERGNYMSIIIAVYGIGTGLGPIIGGLIVQKTSWRWIFYLNLPIGGVALGLLYIFLRVQWDKTTSFWDKLKRIDFIGNTILMAATTSTLFALIYSGVRYSWSSWHIVVPLVMGFVGYALFIWFEGSQFCLEPVTPMRLFQNRTSVVVYANTFLNSVLLYWITYFLPVYFQAVLLSTPARAGVQLLPMTLVAIPGAAISVLVLAKWGKYKALHAVGFALMVLGMGLMSTLDHKSNTAQWVVFQMLVALGGGMVLNTLLPAFQAGIEERDQAAATAAWAFIRSFGNIWGVAIPATVFNNRFTKYSSRIEDDSVRAVFSNGDAYAFVSRDFIKSFPEPAQSQIISVFEDTLKFVWYISLIFGGLTFVLVFFEKQLKLREELATDYGLEEEKKEKNEGV